MKPKEHEATPLLRRRFLALPDLHLLSFLSSTVQLKPVKLQAGTLRRTTVQPADAFLNLVLTHGRTVSARHVHVRGPVVGLKVVPAALTNMVGHVSRRGIAHGFVGTRIHVAQLEGDGFKVIHSDSALHEPLVHVQDVARTCLEYLAARPGRNSNATARHGSAMPSLATVPGGTCAVSFPLLLPLPLSSFPFSFPFPLTSWKPSCIHRRVW